MQRMEQVVRITEEEVWRTRKKGNKDVRERGKEREGERDRESEREKIKKECGGVTEQN